MASTGQRNIDELCVNAVRILSMDAVQKANSGHPGTPMSLAPLATVLWQKHLRHDPADPQWPGRDRFVLSCGHASMLLYSLLHLSGYDLGLDELRNFRQWGSRTPGHPEVHHTPGVETTTGPLGQGVGNAVGMALAQAHLAATFNTAQHPFIDHRTWFIASDGDLMEGISHEAASLAGHLRLGRLIGFFDDNHITIEGSTRLACSDDVEQRFRSYGWQVLRVADGNDLQALDDAMRRATENEAQPSLIVVRTEIAWGSPNKQGSAEAHGAPLGEDEVRQTRQRLGWQWDEAFFVPDEVRSVWLQCRERGAALQAQWQERRAAFEAAEPARHAEWQRRLRGDLPDGWDEAIPTFAADSEPMATRKASGAVLNAIAARVPELIGGSADLGPSNNTTIKGSSAFSLEDRTGRVLHFGVREHAMGAVLNGMTLHGGLRAFGGTFLIFSDYMRGSIRLAALMKLPVTYVFTHDSIGLGEDGPTHQPIESLAALRVIPHLLVFRPADARETSAAWRVAMTHRDGPVALALTRQGLPILRDSAPEEDGVDRGGYILREAEGDVPQVILMASGSEVSLVLEARQTLQGRGLPTRVVSMPCLERFAQQDDAWRHHVLPPEVHRRVAVEAAHPQPWWRWVGETGSVLGIERFGASAPYKTLFAQYGFSVESVVELVMRTGT
jgi:transketolase